MGVFDRVRSLLHVNFGILRPLSFISLNTHFQTIPDHSLGHVYFLSETLRQCVRMLARTVV